LTSFSIFALGSAPLNVKPGALFQRNLGFPPLLVLGFGAVEIYALVDEVEA
jgi:hypothetical protein